MQFGKFRIPILLIVLAIGILLGMQIEKIFSDESLTNNTAKFGDVLKLTEKYYIEKVDTQKLVDAAINGILSKLDPHSVYIPAD